MSRKRLELNIGTRYGLWSVINRDISHDKHTYYKCKCLGCGTVKPVSASAILRGKSTGCSQCKDIDRDAEVLVIPSGPKQVTRTTQHVPQQSMFNRGMRMLAEGIR
jgi:hypothetical protein